MDAITGLYAFPRLHRAGGRRDVAGPALPLTAFPLIVPQKIGRAGSVIEATIGAGHIALTGLTRLVVTVGHMATVGDAVTTPSGWIIKGVPSKGYAWRKVESKAADKI